jgi:hypothetical protein
MSESFIDSERAKHIQEKHFTIVPNKVFRDLADCCLRTNDHEQSFVALFLYARLLDGIYGNNYDTTSTPHDLSKLSESWGLSMMAMDNALALLVDLGHIAIIKQEDNKLRYKMMTYKGPCGVVNGCSLREQREALNGGKDCAKGSDLVVLERFDQTEKHNEVIW